MFLGFAFQLINLASPICQHSVQPEAVSFIKAVDEAKPGPEKEKNSKIVLMNSEFRKFTVGRSAEILIKNKRLEDLMALKDPTTELGKAKAQTDKLLFGDKKDDKLKKQMDERLQEEIKKAEDDVRKATEEFEGALQLVAAQESLATSFEEHINPKQRGSEFILSFNRNLERLGHPITMSVSVVRISHDTNGAPTFLASVEASRPIPVDNKLVMPVEKNWEPGKYILLVDMPEMDGTYYRTFVVE